MGSFHSWWQQPSSPFQPSFQIDSVRVTPEELYRKAGEVSQHIQRLDSLFSQATKTVERTDYYWIGEAGECHRAKMRSYQDEIEDILQRLTAHVHQLEQIADNYISHEDQAASIAQALPSNVIL